MAPIRSTSVGLPTSAAGPAAPTRPVAAAAPTPASPTPASTGTADGFVAAAGATASPAASGFHGTRDAYFHALDADPALRAKATSDAVGALLDVLSRTDVPASLDHEYAKKAGSPGGGRVLLALDYTRGIPVEETPLAALKQGALHFLSSQLISPMLGHFRELGGHSLFPGDATMTPAFRDSPLWGPSTNQVGHLLCAVETGARLGRLSTHGIERRVFELGLKAADAVAGFKNVQGTTADWSRAGIIGHEMIGDQDGSGFIGQMKAYDRLVANGDPDHVRQHWDQAVAAVLAGNHAEAFTHIDAIAHAIEAPTTPADVAANLANEHPRFAAPHHAREGNSREDIALSVYGFAMGYAATTRGFATPAAARGAFEALFSVQGAAKDAIDSAAGVRG